LLARYSISAFQAFISKKWLYSVQIMGAKAGGGEYQERIKLDPTSQKKGKGGVLCSYVPALQKMSNTAEK
jgi:hypothetical protein